MNTLTSWEVIDPACNEEVAGITNGQSQHQVNGPANVNTDSVPFNQDLGLEQVSDINSANNLGTLYNQDFFVADMTNRRLSQIPNKTNYPYPLPNGHAALQLRLPDSRLFKLLNSTAPDDVRMRTTSMHFVNSLRNYLSSKVENRLLGMNEKNYSLGDTFKVALECELKAIALVRRYAKCTTGSTNQVEVVQPQSLLQPEEMNEIHIRNPNYKGKNYDPNFQAKCAEAAHSAGKQQQNSFVASNQYKPAYNKTTLTYGSNNNTPLSNSSDIIGEVALKTSVDGYQLLKVNEMIKNAVAWRARMPKTNKISTYFHGNSKDATQKVQEPKVHINEAMLEVMGQAAKDFSYTEQEFVEAVEMYQYFGNQNLEDVPIPNSQD